MKDGLIASTVPTLCNTDVEETLTHSVFLLSSQRAWHLDRIVSPHPPTHPATAAVLITAIKETDCTSLLRETVELSKTLLLAAKTMDSIREQPKECHLLKKDSDGGSWLSRIGKCHFELC
jgi:hypothetical protein